MKLKFECQEILSGDSPFTEHEIFLLAGLIGQKNLQGLFHPDQLFMILSNLFGEQIDWKLYINKYGITSGKAYQFVKRIDEISENIRIEIETVSSTQDSHEYPEYSWEKYGRYYSVASGIMTINGLTPEEENEIRYKNCNRLFEVIND